MPTRDRTTSRIRGTTVQSSQAARELRRNLTPAEQRLWSALQGKQLQGMRFRVHHAIGPFILDFYCPAHKLAAEVDGSIHDTQTEYDEARTQQLAEFGYKVIRFRNEEIFEDLHGVLNRIVQAVLPGNP
jgi:very-short-patch-repair endonuclease